MVVQSDNSTTNASTGNQQSPPFAETAIWYATVVILSFMIIAIVLGNILVLVTTWIEKHLHQPNKYFIACLAVADLLVGTFSVPIRLYLHLNHTELVALELCRFWSWIDISCEVASIVTLTVISIDRYFKISNPFKYRSQMTTLRSSIVILFIWLIAITFATFGQFSFDSSRGIMAIPGKGCINDNLVYFTIIAAAFFFIPAIVIIVMYAMIFYIAHKRHKMARSGALGESFVASGQNTRGNQLRQELKTIRVLFLVVSMFIVCWGPFFILFLLRNYKPKYISLTKEEIRIVSAVFVVTLPSFNSLCNPIIYACFDREYSIALKRLFHCGQTSSKKTRKRSSTTKSTPSTFRLKMFGSRQTSTSTCAASVIEDPCAADKTLL